MPLIPLHYLNEACTLSLNENDKKYAMCLKMAERSLKAILGYEFFKELESQFHSNTMTTDNAELYEEVIKDYLAWRTYFHYLKFCNVQPTPTGMRIFSEDNSTIAEDITMYALEKNVQEQAVSYQNDIGGHISHVRTTRPEAYPLFPSCGITPASNFSITAVMGCSDTYRQISKAISTNE